jgi:hypothetical protein
MSGRIAVVAPVTLFLIGLLALLAAGLAAQASASISAPRPSDAIAENRLRRADDEAL